MHRKVFTVIVLAGATTLAAISPSLADPCANLAFPAIFCDDFDSYCSPAPTAPAVCDPTATPDNATFLTVWPADDSCDPTSLEHFLADPLDALGTFGAQAVQRGWRWDIDPKYDYLRRHVHDLVPDILAHPANGYNFDAVNGDGEISYPPAYGTTVPPAYVDSMDRTARPDTLKGTFWFNVLGTASQANTIYYHELCLDDDRAPVNFTITTCTTGGLSYHDCNCDGGTCEPGQTPTCDGGIHDGETCASDAECLGTDMPILQSGDGTVHASFAIGMMAIVDSNPCDLDQGWTPSTWRMVVFDGLSWNRFKATYADIPLTSPADIVDFYPLPGWNRVDFAIGADYIEVRLTNIQTEALHSGDGVCIYHTCKGGTMNEWPCETSEDCPSGDPLTPNPYVIARVTRQYKGPFNKYALGPGKGQDMTDPQNPGPLTCLPAYAQEDVVSDEIVLYDGVFESSDPMGACCLPDKSCIDLDEATCVSVYNGRWLGEGTECANTLCCPYPFADADEDGDVDQTDFASFQLCYTGVAGNTPVGCECYDRDVDNDVDAADFAAFSNCYSGPAVTWTAAAAPNCEP